MSPSSQEGRQRLDEMLVARGLFPTRSRARDAIQRGAVSIAGRAETKPGRAVEPGIEIAVEDPARGYVSRAALKLAGGLEKFGIDPAGLSALDVGASTGGFTQVLLERGAARVTAIDVGHGQLHETLRADPRVISIEGLNARDLSLEHLGGVAPQIVVADVSFISLRQALPPALSLAAPGACAVLLVKPQFEAGREAIGKGGLLKDPSLGERIAADMATWLETQAGWRTLGVAPSPIEGGDGNREYLLGGRKDR